MEENLDTNLNLTERSSIIKTYLEFPDVYYLKADLLPFISGIEFSIGLDSETASINVKQHLIIKIHIADFSSSEVDGKTTPPNQDVF